MEVHESLCFYRYRGSRVAKRGSMFPQVRASIWQCCRKNVPETVARARFSRKPWKTAFGWLIVSSISQSVCDSFVHSLRRFLHSCFFCCFGLLFAFASCGWPLKNSLLLHWCTFQRQSFVASASHKRSFRPLISFSHSFSNLVPRHSQALLVEYGTGMSWYVSGWWFQFLYGFQPIWDDGQWVSSQVAGKCTDCMVFQIFDTSIIIYIYAHIYLYMKIYISI